MSTISNRFYVTALEDGTTLHGNLVSDKSLTQSWNGETAVPSWKKPTSGTLPFEEPTIWLTLLSGGTTIAESSINNQKWYYNGEEIYFMSTTSTITVYTNAADAGARTTANITGYWSKASEQSSAADYRFFKHTRTVGGVSVPALRITSDFASSTNVDLDIISFSGSYVINTAGVDFSCDAQVRISSISPTSKLGVINFVNGISDITEKGQEIVLYAALYNSDGQPAECTTQWFLNDSHSGTAGATISGYANAFRVTEAQVTDHATVTCKFYENNVLVYTAFAGIDDMQDPEFMYIQYNGANGNAASLRRGQYAPMVIWVGTREDPTVLGGASTPTYSTIKVKLIDGDGIVIGGPEDTTAQSAARSASLPGANLDPQSPLGWIPACETTPTATSWRNITLSSGKATVNVHYDTANGYGKKNLTGIVVAYATTTT